MVPTTARLVTVIPKTKIAIYDVTLILPRHPRKKYNAREKPISQIFVHKSGANGPPGYRGYQSCAFFCVQHRKWAGVPYHYWISQQPDFDSKNNLVIYQGQSENVVSWHTGGANTWSVGIGVQGNFDGEWDLVNGLPEIARKPTLQQITMLDALVDYLCEQHGLSLKKAIAPFALSGHWEAPRPKAVCPGDALRHWVMNKRDSPLPPTPQIPFILPTETQKFSKTKPYKWPIHDLQRALAFLKHKPGMVDGILGYKTRKAIEKFQAENSLIVDGWVGKKTALALQQKLLSKNIFTLKELRYHTNS